MNPPQASVAGGDLQDSQQEDPAATTGGAPAGADARMDDPAALALNPAPPAQLRALLAAWDRLDGRARVALLQTAEALART